MSDFVVRNPETGEVRQVPADQVAQLVAFGGWETDQPIPFVTTDDRMAPGVARDANEFRRAFRASQGMLAVVGAESAVRREAQAAEAEAATQRRVAETSTAGEAFGVGLAETALSPLTLGAEELSSFAAEQTGAPDVAAAGSERMRRVVEARPGAAMGGQAAGLGLSLLTPLGVGGASVRAGEAATSAVGRALGTLGPRALANPGLMRRVAPRLAGLAVEEGAASVGYAMADANLRDVPLAGQAVLADAGIGLVLGLGTMGLGGLLGRMGQRASRTESGRLVGGLLRNAEEAQGYRRGIEDAVPGTREGFGGVQPEDMAALQNGLIPVGRRADVELPRLATEVAQQADRLAERGRMLRSEVEGERLVGRLRAAGLDQADHATFAARADQAANNLDMWASRVESQSTTRRPAVQDALGRARSLAARLRRASFDEVEVPRADGGVDVVRQPRGGERAWREVDALANEVHDAERAWARARRSGDPGLADADIAAFSELRDLPADAAWGEGVSRLARARQGVRLRGARLRSEVRQRLTNPDVSPSAADAADELLYDDLASQEFDAARVGRMFAGGEAAASAKALREWVADQRRMARDIAELAPDLAPLAKELDDLATEQAERLTIAHTYAEARAQLARVTRQEAQRGGFFAMSSLGGGTVGGLLGGPAGAVAGLGAGVAMARYFRPANYYQAKEAFSAAVGGAFGRMNQNLSTAARVFANGFDRNLRFASLPAVHAMATADEKKEAYRRIRDDLMEIASNPNILVDRLSQSGDAFEMLGSDYSTEFAATAARASDYLIQHLPAGQADPLDAAELMIEPSMGEIDEFLARYRALEDPTSLLADFARGQLHAASVDAVRGVMPQYYAEMAAGMAEMLAAARRRGKVNYQARLAAGLFLGFDADPSLDGRFVLAMQNAGATNEVQQAAVRSQGQGAGPRPTSLPRDSAARTATSTQRPAVR